MEILYALTYENMILIGIETWINDDKFAFIRSLIVLLCFATVCILITVFTPRAFDPKKDDLVSLNNFLSMFTHIGPNHLYANLSSFILYGTRVHMKFGPSSWDVIFMFFAFCHYMAIRAMQNRYTKSKQEFDSQYWIYRWIPKFIRNFVYIRHKKWSKVFFAYNKTLEFFGRASAGASAGVFGIIGIDLALTIGNLFKSVSYTDGFSWFILNPYVIFSLFHIVHMINTIFYEFCMKDSEEGKVGHHVHYNGAWWGFCIGTFFALGGIKKN